MKNLLIAIALLCCFQAQAGVEFDNDGNALGVGNGSGYEVTSYSDSPTNSDGPWAVACWFLVDSTAEVQSLYESASATSTSNFSVLWVRDDGKLAALIKSGGGAGRPESIAAVTTGVWHSAILADVDDNDHRVYLDGVRGTDAIEFESPINPTRTILGMHHPASDQGFGLIGKLAHVAVWVGYAFTDADAVAWHSRMSPFKIGVGKLQDYWPLNGDGPVGTRVRNLVNGVHLVQLNGPSVKTDSPPLRQPFPRYGLYITGPTQDPLHISERCREEDYYALAC